MIVFRWIICVEQLDQSKADAFVYNPRQPQSSSGCDAAVVSHTPILLPFRHLHSSPLLLLLSVEPQPPYSHPAINDAINSASGSNVALFLSSPPLPGSSISSPHSSNRTMPRSVWLVARRPLPSHHPSVRPSVRSFVRPSILPVSPVESAGCGGELYYLHDDDISSR